MISVFFTSLMKRNKILKTLQFIYTKINIGILENYNTL